MSVLVVMRNMSASRVVPINQQDNFMSGTFEIISCDLWIPVTRNSIGVVLVES